MNIEKIRLNLATKIADTLSKRGIGRAASNIVADKGDCIFIYDGNIQSSIYVSIDTMNSSINASISSSYNIETIDEPIGVVGVFSRPSVVVEGKVSIDDFIDVIEKNLRDAHQRFTISNVSVSEGKLVIGERIYPTVKNDRELMPILSKAKLNGCLEGPNSVFVDAEIDGKSILFHFKKMKANLNEESALRFHNAQYAHQLGSLSEFFSHKGYDAKREISDIVSRAYNQKWFGFKDFECPVFYAREKTKRSLTNWLNRNADEIMKTIFTDNALENFDKSAFSVELIDDDTAIITHNYGYTIPLNFGDEGETYYATRYTSSDKFSVKLVHNDVVRQAINNIKKTTGFVRVEILDIFEEYAVENGFSDKNAAAWASVLESTFDALSRDNPDRLDRILFSGEPLSISFGKDSFFIEFTLEKDGDKFVMSDFGGSLPNLRSVSSITELRDISPLNLNELSRYLGVKK